MKMKTMRILAGILFSAVVMTGCGSNEATKAVNESIETEKEGISQNEDELELLKPTSEPEVTPTPEAGEDAEEVSEEPEEIQEEEPAVKVGVLFPENVQGDRWDINVETLCSSLMDYGYEPIVYRAKSSEEQEAQIGEALAVDAKALIITPVRAYALDEALQKAKEESIPVISYDELLMDTDGVNYYVTYSSRSMGEKMGDTIIQKMMLEDARKNGTSLNVEFLMGSPDDIDALFFYNGVMEKLQEYFQDGTLVCPSGKTAFSDVAIMRGDQNSAYRELFDRLQTFYADGTKADIICTGLDSLAAGAVEALKESQIMPQTEAWPFISGLGCEAEAVRSIAKEEQTASLFMDSRTLAQECAKLTDTCLKGETPEVNDYETFDNGRKIVGTVTCEAQVIDADNYQMLIDNGYYTAEEVEPELNVYGSTPEEKSYVPEENRVSEEEINTDETPDGEQEAEPEKTEPEEPEAEPTGKPAVQSGPRFSL